MPVLSLVLTNVCGYSILLKNVGFSLRRGQIQSNLFYFINIAINLFKALLRERVASRKLRLKFIACGQGHHFVQWTEKIDLIRSQQQKLSWRLSFVSPYPS